MSGDQVVDSLAGSTIGHVVELQACHLLEPLADDVLVGADAGGRITEAGIPLDVIPLDVIDQLGDRIDAERRMRGEDLRLARQVDDRQELLGVVMRKLHDVRRARRVVVGDQDRVAVRRALHREIHPERPARPGPVLHHHLLAERPRHVFADRTGDEVDAAARRQRHDEAQRPAGPRIARALRMHHPASRERSGGRRRSGHEAAPRNPAHSSPRHPLLVMTTLTTGPQLRQAGRFGLPGDN
jgi:hypothetical protein